MRNLMKLGGFAATIFFVLIYVTSAHAQATRTWVSGVGDDANPCSRTAPCKTFAGSISKTAAGGEIDCLDPGGFGALTITKSITILCDSVVGGVLVSGTNGIVVSVTAGTRVILSGLDFEGIGTGLNGVNITSGGQVIIRNSIIRDFLQNGVQIAAATATPAPRVEIINCLITNNGTQVNTPPYAGINVAGNGGSTNNAEVLNTIIDSNGSVGISVTGPGSLVLAGSVVTGQSTAISVTSGGQVVSYGNNVIRNTGTPTSTLPLQ